MLHTEARSVTLHTEARSVMLHTEARSVVLHTESRYPAQTVARPAMLASCSLADIWALGGRQSMSACTDPKPNPNVGTHSLTHSLTH